MQMAELSLCHINVLGLKKKRQREMIIGHLIVCPEEGNSAAENAQLDCLTEKKSKRQGGCQSGGHFQHFTTAV